ncbi:MAG: hypothetical protein KDD58_09170 [Bdellovibrionales bacterium]|nr:hypothetical protein [Bdellovibrionales bacterium]
MEQFEIWDKQIKEGKGLLVRKEILKVNHLAISYRNASVFSDLCRRVGLVNKGLKALRPHLFLRSGFDQNASLKLIISYCQLLLKIGASNLVIETLKDKPDDKLTTLTLAYACMTNWQMDQAKISFVKYINTYDLTEYETTLAKLNLSGTLRFLGEINKCQAMLNSIIESCKKNNWSLILGNCFELMGLTYFDQNDLKTAMYYFDLSLNLLEKTNDRYNLYVEVWKMLLGLKKSPESQKISNQLEALKTKSLNIEELNSVRTIDLYKSIITKDLDLFRHTLSGTPYLEYRNRAMRISNFKISLDKFYNFNIDHSLYKKTKDIVLLDLYTGLLKKPNDKVKKIPKTIHLLFKSLICDFYRMPMIGQAFCEMFPGEYFNPDVSPRRVYVTAQRLRSWLQQEEVGLTCKLKNNRLSLISNSKITCISVCIDTNYFPNMAISEENILYQKRLNQMKTYNVQLWTAKLVSQSLNISIRSSQYLLKNAVTNGDLVKVKQGKSVFYKIIKQ